jgi:hypothetical protein
MLISTGRPLPRCSSISESELSVPKSNPTCRARICWLVRPSRPSDPAISQFCPSDCPAYAGSTTERFSFEPT